MQGTDAGERVCAQIDWKHRADQINPASAMRASGTAKGSGGQGAMAFNMGAEIIQ